MCIRADGAPPPAPTIIVPARRQMENRYTESMAGKKQVLLTNSWSIDKFKALDWLDCFI